MLELKGKRKATRICGGSITVVGIKYIAGSSTRMCPVASSHISTLCVQQNRKGAQSPFFSLIHSCSLSCQCNLHLSKGHLN